MATDKQIAANRANAQKSTGPVTPAGKERSSLNAWRHGLTRHTRLMPSEEMQAYQDFTEPLVADLKPVGANETQLAQSYADYQWRVHRIASIEDNMFTLGYIEDAAENLMIEHSDTYTAASNAKTFRRDSRDFDRLSTYNQRLAGQAAKVLTQLRQIQADRRTQEDSEMSRAIDIYRAHRQANAIFEPERTGFVLTVPQIEARIRRQHLDNPTFISQEVEKGRIKTA